MRHSNLHSHSCKACGVKYDCDAPLERNYDGFPEVVCYAYHEANIQDCEDCIDRMQEAYEAEIRAQDLEMAAYEAEMMAKDRGHEL